MSWLVQITFTLDNMLTERFQHQSGFQCCLCYNWKGTAKVGWTEGFHGHMRTFPMLENDYALQLHRKERKRCLCHTSWLKYQWYCIFLDNVTRWVGSLSKMHGATTFFRLFYFFLQTETLALTDKSVNHSLVKLHGWSSRSSYMVFIALKRLFSFSVMAPFLVGFVKRFSFLHTRSSASLICLNRWQLGHLWYSQLKFYFLFPLVLTLRTWFTTKRFWGPGCWFWASTYFIWTVT